MKFRIKNNRLALENVVKNLSDISEYDLRKIAGKYQIGWQRFVEKDVQKSSRGRLITSTEQVIEPKPRKQLEDEIRRLLTISLIVPKELWTEEQSAAFIENDLSNEKDIAKEVEVKKAAKIQVDLPPFEDGKDMYTQALMTTELNEGQWEYFKKYYCTKIELIRDKTDRVIDKREKYIGRLEVVEEIPETEEERQRLLDKKIKIAAKQGNKEKVAKLTEEKEDVKD